MALKYKEGDKVKIKSLDWYNKNKNSDDDIVFADGWHFSKPMSNFCGKELIIERISNAINPPHYMMRDIFFAWTDEMIEGLVEEKNNDCEKYGLVHNSTRCLFMDNCPHNKQKNIIEIPEDYVIKDENGNIINATKIVLEKKSPKTDDIIKWLREHDMTKYIGVLYSGMCSITFDTEKLIKDITEMIGDE